MPPSISIDCPPHRTSALSACPTSIKCTVSSESSGAAVGAAVTAAVATGASVGVGVTVALGVELHEANITEAAIGSIAFRMFLYFNFLKCIMVIPCLSKMGIVSVYAKSEMICLTAVFLFPLQESVVSYIEALMNYVFTHEIVFFHAVPIL